MNSTELLDFFAGCALIACSGRSQPMTPEALGTACYTMAQAMLDARAAHLLTVAGSR